MKKYLLCLLTLAILPVTTWAQMHTIADQSIASSKVVLAGQPAITDVYFQEGGATYSGGASNTEGDRSATGSVSFTSQMSSSLISVNGSASASQNSTEQESEAYGHVNIYGNITVEDDTYIRLSLSATVTGNNSANLAVFIKIFEGGNIIAELSSAQSINSTLDLLLQPGTIYAYQFNIVADKNFTQTGAGAYGMQVSNAHASIAAIPEPSTYALLALALAALLWTSRRRLT